MLDTEKFVDAVLDECARLGTFKEVDITQKMTPPAVSDEERYAWSDHTTSALTFLERKKLISGQNKVEFTLNLGLPKQVRQGTLTKLGRILSRSPRLIRTACLFVLLKWKALLSVLGALAFVKLVHNAYLGAALLVGWIEYVSALILIWIVYLLIRRALG